LQELAIFFLSNFSQLALGLKCAAVLSDAETVRPEAHPLFPDIISWSNKGCSVSLPINLASFRPLGKHNYKLAFNSFLLQHTSLSVSNGISLFSFFWGLLQ